MDHNKPLMVAAGHDSLQQIGGCLHGSISVTLYLWEWERTLKRVVCFLLLFVINSKLIYGKTIKSIYTGTCTINTCIRNDMNVSQVPVHIDVNTFLHI